VRNLLETKIFVQIFVRVLKVACRGTGGMGVGGVTLRYENPRGDRKGSDSLPYAADTVTRYDKTRIKILSGGDERP